MIFACHIRPGQRADEVILSTARLAAWRWVTAELGRRDMTEPFDLDRVIALCELASRGGDCAHRKWAEIVMGDIR